MPSVKARFNWQWFPETGIVDPKYQHTVKLIAYRKRRTGAVLTVLMGVFVPVWVFGHPWILSAVEFYGVSLMSHIIALGDVGGKMVLTIVWLLGVVALPTVLVLWGGHALWKRIVGRELHRCLHEPACVHCGYSLKGIPVTGEAATCPECGKESPVASTQASADA